MRRQDPSKSVLRDESPDERKETTRLILFACLEAVPVFGLATWASAPGSGIVWAVLAAVAIAELALFRLAALRVAKRRALRRDSDALPEMRP
jgi:hypothetical protein